MSFGDHILNGLGINSNHSPPFGVRYSAVLPSASVAASLLVSELPRLTIAPFGTSSDKVTAKRSDPAIEGGKCPQTVVRSFPFRF